MTLDFLRNYFKFASFVKIPAVRADDDDEEEELHDPQVGLRVKCRGIAEAVALREKLDECNKRVRSKKRTKETCEEELHDLVRFVDHCVSKELFDYLK